MAVEDRLNKVNLKIVNPGAVHGTRPLALGLAQTTLPILPEAGSSLDRFLSSLAEGKAAREYRQHKVVYSEGDAALAIYLVRRGVVALSQESPDGREAVLCMLGAGQIFGEECLFPQSPRRTTATALTDCQVTRVDKDVITAKLRERPDYYAMLFASLVDRTAQLEARLKDRFLYRGETRLACTLLALANLSTNGKRVIPKLSQETLAQLAGMTRPRACVALREFREKGFLVWGPKEIEVRDSLRTILDGR